MIIFNLNTPNLPYFLGALVSILFNYYIILPKVISEFDDHTLQLNHKMIILKKKDIRREYNNIKKALKNKNFWVDIHSKEKKQCYLHQVLKGNNNDDSLLYYIICFEQLNNLKNDFDDDVKRAIFNNIKQYIFIICKLSHYEYVLYIKFLYEYFPHIMEDIFYSS